MNLKTVGQFSGVAGVLLFVFAGGAVARRSGFGAESWLILAFGFGVLLLSQATVLRLQQELRDLQARLASRSGT